jgi:hypothetical protein
MTTPDERGGNSDPLGRTWSADFGKADAEAIEQAEYDSLYQFAWDNYRRANRHAAHVARLQEENRSLVQTIRRILRGTPVDER